MSTILKSILNLKRITRNDLSNMLKLSPSSIVKYLKILIERELIEETEREISTGGRRSTFLEFNPEIGLNIALILDETNLHGALINTRGNTVHDFFTPTYNGIFKDELLTLIYKGIEGLIKKAGELNKKIFGIGIGLGGYLDPHSGISHEYLYAKDWYSVPLKDLIESTYRLPCFLVKDTIACILGEKYYGNAIGVNHFLGVWIGEGLGMGIVVNGEVYSGYVNYAGELGHTRDNSDNMLCYCGHTGCIETLTSTQYIITRCMEGLRQGVNSDMLKLCEGNIDKLKIEDVITAANSGDRLARNIFEQVGIHLGNKLSDIANVFNPELIILRGPVIDGNPFLFENIQRIVNNQSLKPIAHSLRIIHSKERDDIRLKGIGSVILINYFSQ